MGTVGVGNGSKANLVVMVRTCVDRPSSDWKDVVDNRRDCCRPLAENMLLKQEKCEDTNEEEHIIHQHHGR